MSSCPTEEDINVFLDEILDVVMDMVDAIDGTEDTAPVEKPMVAVAIGVRDIRLIIGRLLSKANLKSLDMPTPSTSPPHP